MKAKIIVTLYIKNVTGALYTVNYNENTLSVPASVNAAWNSVVLTARRNDCSEVAALTDEVNVMLIHKNYDFSFKTDL